MKYLLDTHTFIWMAGEPAKLSGKVNEIVSKGQSELYLSAASAWEMALLWKLKLIELPDEPQRFVPEVLHTLSVTPLPIGVNQAIAAATLPLIHRDPFDRIIIAEAIMRKMTVLTRDERLADYGVQILW
jgi:PIN domain nuclease of toxin-antitoxin system